ncbi:MAG: Flp family type IVb pilin [Pirellulales bacterium]|nr:Flp family type IVb pilin [Pirellulales bacterium]
MTSNLTQKLVRFLRNEDGPTAVEYAFLLALILLVAVTSITLFGEATNTCFENSNEEFGRVMP